MTKAKLTRRELLAATCGMMGVSLLSAAGSPLRAVTGQSPMWIQRQFKPTMTTMFWVGEESDAENAFIPNDASYWDANWQSSFGGVDHPFERNGHWPAGFKPKENPFYVALPYGEFEEDNSLKQAAQSCRGTGQACRLCSRTAGWKSGAASRAALRNGKMSVPAMRTISTMCSARRQHRSTASTRKPAWMSRPRSGTISA